MRAGTIAISLLLLAGCGSIEQYQTLEQPTGKVLTAGLGDTILRVENSKSLPNVFGAADIFGRRTSTGTSQITFLGVERDGTIVLARRDIEIVTNETTMSASRNPFVVSSAQGSATTNVVGSGSTATATTNANAQQITIQPTSDYHVVIPPDVIPIRIPSGTTSVPLAGHMLEILKGDSVSLSYRIAPMQ